MRTATDCCHSVIRRTGVPRLLSALGLGLVALGALAGLAGCNGTGGGSAGPAAPAVAQLPGAGTSAADSQPVASRQSAADPVRIRDVTFAPAASSARAPSRFRGRLVNQSLQPLQDVAVYCEAGAYQAAMVEEYAFQRVVVALRPGQETEFGVSGQSGNTSNLVAQAHCRWVQVVYADGSTVAEPALLHMDRFLAGIGLEMPRGSLETMLGAAECQPLTGPESSACSYRNGQVQVQYRADSSRSGPASVSSIAIRSGSTPRGLTVGDGTEAVLRFYGTPAREFPGLLQYWDTQGKYGWFHLEFQLEQGRVSRIQALRSV